jgi:hypothetical protein
VGKIEKRTSCDNKFALMWSKRKLLVPKLDGLHKHSRRRKCKCVKPRPKLGQYYTNFDSWYAKNEHISSTTSLDYVLE